MIVNFINKKVSPNFKIFFINKDKKNLNYHNISSNSEIKKNILNSLSKRNFKGNLGQICHIEIIDNKDLVNIVFIGIGDETKLEGFNFQYFGGLLFPYFENFKYKSSSIYVGDVKRVKLSYENMVLNLASGIYLKSYSFKKYKKNKEEDSNKIIENIDFIVSNSAKLKKLFSNFKAVAEGVFFARDLLHEPPNVLNPVNLASRARDLSKLGLKKNSSSINKAKKAGFSVLSPEKAIEYGEIVMILIPDELQPELYKNIIKKKIAKNAYLGFAHGFSIHFKFIKPRKDLNIFMVAPKGPGHLVRSEYKNKRGVPCLLAIEKSVSNDTKNIGLSYASAVGGGRTGIIETTFREECETDLFGEQVVLCGGLTSLIKSGFETLVKAGYKPEMAYFECLHEIKLIVDLIYEGGIANMRYSISNTAEYGDFTRGPRIINSKVQKEMKKILKEIQSGKFAKEWMKENKEGRKKFNRYRKLGQNHKIESFGNQLRKMMPWIEKNKIIR